MAHPGRAGTGPEDGGTVAAVGWLQRLVGGNAARPRWDGTAGRPTSSNGASSLHLFWSVAPHRPSTAVEAVLEVVEPPTVAALHFWALQVTFAGPRVESGGAHLGLQLFDRDQAVAALRQAVALGLPLWEIEGNRDLEPVRKDPRFQRASTAPPKP